MSTRWKIYALVDPTTDRIRYIGKTVNVAQRLSCHLNEARNPRFSHTHKNRWIAALLDAGMRPLVRVLEEGQGEWKDAEVRWIALALDGGEDLPNATSGGDGLTGLSVDGRRRLSEYRKALWADPESRAALMASYTPERGRKISAALTGRRHSAEHVAKLRQNQPTTRVAFLAAIKQEQARFPRNYRSGWHWSDAEKRKRSVGQLGRLKTTETREKMRLAALRRWAREREEAS